MVKSENIFKLWKKMYLARKEFRDKLFKNSKDILTFNIDHPVHLWNIIQQSNNRTKLIKHFKSWSFSPIYLSNPLHAYSPYSKKNYLAEQRYLSGSLKPYFQQDLPSLLDDDKIWNEYVAVGSDYLLFNHFVVIPHEDQSLLGSFSNILSSLDFIENERGTWRKYFLEDFCQNHLKTKKQRKEFKWLFQGG